MKETKGLTIREIAGLLNIESGAAKMRLLRAGIKPKGRVGVSNVYSQDVVAKVKVLKQRGRPRKKTK